MESPCPSRPAFNFAEGEVLLIDKPLRWTSFDVVRKIRNAMKPLKVKVGHAGTLDPLATGLLVVCTGKFTKRIDEFQSQKKEYTGTITLGATTPSYDLERAIDQRFDLSGITYEQINGTAASFVGEIEQIPPAHSAIKMDGERVYEKARRGEAVEVKPRNVHIYEFEITAIQLPDVDFRVVCSKGTYIRSLAHDFGKAMNNGAHLSRLRRTRSGDFNVAHAWQMTDLVNHIKGFTLAVSDEDIQKS
ncbi:tRNA pseudouridine(55) synthase TruB [Parapedobacter sp. ISTM3]|uniref:tRNA pseudouridine synthase B n=1 Tax=Parapedobacter luteus TaxID=623280 RepID=A0A1T5E4F7_9SPHI|nr:MULTISPECIES: tRNA pseudouridine(55) synthase TruB [Parapedobacter]MBK1441067.1 tRNA pseudouridine(55) synthase TruB [Parapedobacter sp. ISTM3]SKB78734.1 tRNA pseudouridine55 synthase [Parapedobacter luteus]